MTDVSEIEKIVQARLSERRFSHTTGVAKEAVSLAEKWGADKECAYLAGLVHDFAKEIPKNEAIEKLREFGETEFDYSPCPSLIHGPLGARLALQELGIADSSVLDAIRYHTTGRRGMTLLEKIIYLADFIEPSRKFDGVESVRRMAYEDIDKAILLEADMVIGFVLERGQFLHEETVRMRNELLMKTKEEENNEG